MRRIPFFTALAASITGIKLQVTSEVEKSTAKLYSEENKNKLQATITDHDELLERIEFVEMIFDEFNVFVDHFDHVDVDSFEYDEIIEEELPYWLDELNWGLEAIIKGIKD